MGQRTIDTILRVQGEGNYKTALRNCTAELKVQKSELEKVTSEYRTNANSMEALTKKGEVLSRMYATQQQKVELLRYAMEKAQSTRDSEEKTVSDLREQYAAAQQKLASFGETVGKASEEYKQQKSEVDQLRDAIIQHQAKLDSSTKSYSYYAAQLNKAEVELDALTDQQEENMRLLDEAKNSADGCATSIDRYGEAVRDSADATGRSTFAVEAMAQAMVASGIQQKVEDLAAELHEASKAAQEYEVSIKKIGTVSDQTVLSHQAMKEDVLELSTDLRKNAGDVSDAVYEALSAGVETAHVLDFTKDASKLAVAGYTEVATSVDVLTTIINAYKLEIRDKNIQDKIDAVLTHPIAGLPIFAIIMFLVFHISQSDGSLGLGVWLADLLVGWLEAFQGWVGELVSGAAPILQALLVDGIIGGVAAVVGFLPLVMVMYFLIALLEDCGYMARATVVLDPIFKKVGLSGKSVIPFVIGTGCAIPGVMACRTIRNERERRATAMLTPFMPCGAKLPVIALFAGAFFDDAGWVGTLMYFVGIALILVGALLVNKIAGHKARKSFFIIELPEYKLPSVKRACRPDRITPSLYQALLGPPSKPNYSPSQFL